ncbi:MAG TPA: DUF1987 domain-containing protein [Bacteroidia bacterium]|jgi:hypothetical protein|nr:DUF1987 domain-containing protein [Bacteroidia bacterium]HWY97991.1 DUF1987 domain-containing protein [Bacteroidia bacterium]
MEVITIESSPKTPSIKFDSKQGKLEIKGRSIPENSVEFYKPLVESLERYASAPTTPTQVDIQLEYFNTASSKCILDVLKRLETIHRQGNQVIINWYYEEDDEDMREAGEDYQAIVNLTFNMQQVELD